MSDTPDTLWTPQARQAYEASAEQLVQALREHVRATLDRTGDPDELEGYSSSCEQLQEALDGFADAELDWCGSLPVAKGLDLDALDGHEHGAGCDHDHDDEHDHGDDLDEEDEEPGDPALAGTDVLSVLGRWDFRVTDAAALLAHGRAAYRESWPEDTDDDASARVIDVETAVAQVLHTGDITSLDAAPGLAPMLSAVQLVLHEGGQDDDEVFDDPFSIAD